MGNVLSVGAAEVSSTLRGVFGTYVKEWYRKAVIIYMEHIQCAPFVNEPLIFGRPKALSMYH